MQVDFRPSRFWRVLSGIWLCLAVILIIGGQTVWQPRLSGMGFIVFWSACFLSAILAAICALLDLWTIRRETRMENRRLFHETLNKIQESTYDSESESTGADIRAETNSTNQDLVTPSQPPLNHEQD